MRATGWLLGQALLTLGAWTASDFYCDHGDVLYGSFCYFFGSWTASWRDAEDYCFNVWKGHLASFHSIEEVNFLKACAKGYWIWAGFRRTNGHNSVFTDGTPSDYLPWGENQPRAWEDASCVRIGSDGRLYYYLCHIDIQFICKKAANRGPNPLKLSEPQSVWTDACGWWAHNPSNDYCYLLMTEYKMNWDDAKDYCTRNGGNLLSITDFNEQDFVQDYFQVSVNGISLWTGGYSLNAEEKWKWSDGSKMEYIRWSTGEPEDDKPVQRCLSWNLHSHRWKEDNCGSDRGFICKMR
ncbi:macrophage mannose receptor 1-like [Hippocampus comes]|uniref:macrophage mannose receptor 1-like n=1 Tax=Hippocampus comes TaxID=109280 RepID=UPI00094DFF36|nr:PREDICTED: macrophage mannose receptor 1-like [Hippocampus comes]